MLARTRDFENLRVNLANALASASDKRGKSIETIESELDKVRGYLAKYHVLAKESYEESRSRLISRN